MSTFKKIGVIAKKDDDSVLDSLKIVIKFLENKQIDYFLDENSASLLKKNEFFSINDICNKVDFGIVIGGDGTLLNAAQYFANSNIPICGINRGRLGFLADISPKDIEKQLSLIFSKNYIKDTRFSLSAALFEGDKLISENIAFNDVVIHSTNAIRMITIDISINSNEVYRINADGIVLSTPTGSTAYALSGGGPILQPTLEAILLVPICPHILSNRPIVIDVNSEVEIKLCKSSHTDAYISYDGQINTPFKIDNLVSINKSEIKLNLIQPPDHNYLSILREKLGWGTKP